MADSDEEYIAEFDSDERDDDLGDDDEDDELDSRNVSRGRTRRSRGKRKKQRDGHEFEVSRTWESLVEGADGTISSTVEGLLEAGKRKRLLRDTTPLQRGIIRHLILVLDLSIAMSEKDVRPTRYLLTLRYAQEFVLEYFEQNPISQLGIIGMRDGLAVRISDMSGNPSEHILAIQALRTRDPTGLPSLQNALEMARGALFHTPSHGTREVLIIFGTLLSSDPGDIHKTITSLVADKIRVGVVGLAAEVAICREICSKTNAGDDSGYGVALNEQHFRELMMEITTPPVTRSQKQAVNSLLMMGFPSRTVEPSQSLCACHSKPSRGGYLCSRCGSKICTLPAECPACGLTLILSTHLARSYHHLFPLINWVEVPWNKASISSNCFACGNPFPPVPVRAQWETRGGTVKGMSVSSRYECTVCHNHFCIDCDVFAHEIVHNCPGCQSGNTRPDSSKVGHANAPDNLAGVDEMDTG
ncbi:TFIIH basal transcription factor complex p47 subunit, putative [Coccidioides posadasii C735 delta SOWgp]|uniref:General transcription and DNA repair factor IIH n=2 Tax=Coccidioides posadasii TaxID=199306 RepID=A0A0J6FDK2_COCPO|nr:TFIIH basal transcription factor complex p47 subunit, putative [Coccidioides posadasii C735 delta SOWgp]EER27501.1 TFIIH basal transcription factor complex p47 subunit, putative [Coccidioides posadasii C735 delta SOWgp]KMM67345.1 TFIIH basal transcription factor complex p44 subunit [Coccidioides posadasii RMSCC 3488]|eukprot:XP_003069646.1 TFIIH basal transcription factor complex p47 subunit, putative [Coccidioides posadasii C735 delta SOWgp]